MFEAVLFDFCESFICTERRRRKANPEGTQLPVVAVEMPPCLRTRLLPFIC